MKIVQRLENALLEYEDTLWLMRLMVRTDGGDISKIPIPEVLRKALEEGNFAASMMICSDLFDGGKPYKFSFDLASDIADWCAFSKRIFSLSADLGEMLLVTELPDFSPQDIKFVAQAYVVHLKQPVKTKDGREHDFILCSYCPETRALSIRSYPKAYDDYRPISRNEKVEMVKNAQMKNRHWRKFVDRVIKDCNKRFVVGYTVALISGTSTKDAILLSAPDDEREDWEILYKLALGTNLYLQSARADDDEKVTIIGSPDGEVAKSSKIKGPSGPKLSVTKGAQLFELSASKAFESHGAHDSGTEEKWTVRPHFRRGYWRRPSGLGHDPSAPATIWVRPTWIHPERIAGGEHPVGSFQDVPIA